MVEKEINEILSAIKDDSINEQQLIERLRKLSRRSCTMPALAEVGDCIDGGAGYKINQPYIVEHGEFYRVVRWVCEGVDDRIQSYLCYDDMCYSWKTENEIEENFSDEIYHFDSIDEARRAIKMEARKGTIVYIPNKP